MIFAFIPVLIFNVVKYFDTVVVVRDAPSPSVNVADVKYL